MLAVFSLIRAPTPIGSLDETEDVLPGVMLIGALAFKIQHPLLKSWLTGAHQEE
jgi:hypothetical protein